MQHVFLDANVLFSAAYREKAGLLRLWQLPGVLLVTSAYAVREAETNLPLDAQQARLKNLLRTVTITPHIAGLPDLPVGIVLPPKDAPILQAAIHAGATVLLTGDIAHFGRLFGHTICGVRILLPAEFLHGKTLSSD